MGNWNFVESGILVWIQENLRMPYLDGAMTFCSWLNNAGMIAIITTVLLVLWKRYRAAGIACATSLAIEFVTINVVLKPWVQRIRPYDVNEAIHILGERPMDYSFPSGHTGAAFAVALVMLFCMPKKWGISATVIAGLIAFSRLYNGVHYPTDVLGAFGVAFATAFFASKVVFPKILRRLQQTKSLQQTKV